ncbi:hypothetical protein FHS29_004183 [Saccharothrix tamanrassetensis]|uniref:Uncharacterized protein n=1 Tax=Saccharothrix tamanrassetensis TaxID=1051531 RepID=A0A841CN82_9PSEU|nr:hypothetical protein [Saccharothrix tamanrassetensis]MBB5957588.1 hypothetical protein [Saccharothrix tamanrassetensis]
MEVLGWSGVHVPRVKVLGIEADAVVRVDPAAHDLRRAAGQGPVLDHDVLSTWDWPEARDVRAPEVVRLVGMVCGGPSWRRALGAAARLGAFCETAITVEEVTDECRLECAYFGVHLLVAGRLVQEGRRSRPPRRTLDRWVEESVYERLITDGMLR